MRGDRKRGSERGEKCVTLSSGEVGGDGNMRREDKGGGGEAERRGQGDGGGRKRRKRNRKARATEWEEKGR